MGWLAISNSTVAGPTIESTLLGTQLMKIVISNTIALNPGDGAILYGVIEILKQTFGQGTQFIVYDKDPDVASRYYPDIDFRGWLYPKLRRFPKLGKLSGFFRSLNMQRIYTAARFFRSGWISLAKGLLSQEEWAILSDYHGADLVVSTGGTYLVENYPMGSRIFDFNLTLALQKPLVFFTQSLGPFQNPENQRALQPIFNQSLLIMVRDQASVKHLSEISVQQDKIFVTADAAFALAPPQDPEQAVQPNPRLKVAISVRYWPHFKSITADVGMQNYLTSLATLTQALVESGQVEVTYISTCQGIDEYWTDDSKVALEIYQMLPEAIQAHVTVNQDFHTPIQLQSILQNFDMVIATRMHMAILSLLSGVPVLPIAYEFKTHELFEQLGLSHWTQDIESIQPDAFLQHALTFVNQLPDTQAHLNQEIEKIQQLALASGIEVKKRFEAWAAQALS